MKPESRIDYECFEELTRQLQTAGYTVTAQKLDDMLHRVAWTTGSELMGELGLEILAFQRTKHKAGAELQGTMTRCMDMVRRIWPDIRGIS